MNIKHSHLHIHTLLKISVERNASDLHLSADSPPILRIDGELIPMHEVPVLDRNTIRQLIYSLLDQEQQDKLESLLEIDFSFFLPAIAGFRINIFHQLRGLSAVIRVIPPVIPSFERLRSPRVLQELLKLENGLILVTGPTGCGKSTTCAAMIEHINTTQASHIITIEDPIEFIYQSKQSLIHQRQVFRDTLTFNSALHSALREDPDIILIGEMRDLDTIRLALTAAETGHLVLATLHTPSAPRAISRIIDVFPTGEKNIIRNLIAESLQAVICQTLVKRINGGRVAAYEILLGTPASRNLIREDKLAQLYSVMQTSGSIGMCTMQQSLQRLIANKID